MSGIEDILGQVMASHDQDAPAAPDLLRALKATPGPPGRRGKWPGLITPLAAAAAVTAVVAASLAISTAFRGHARPAGPGPAAQSHPSPAPLRPAALRQAALRQVPRYFAALARTGPVQLIGGEAAVVRSTVTGHILATVAPPRPYRIFTWVSAAADDRTFVLAAQRYWPIASGQAGMPAQNRDITTPTVFFKLAFDPATHTAKLARLAVPETIQASQLAGMTVSPDGTRLALDLAPVHPGRHPRHRGDPVLGLAGRRLDRQLQAVRPGLLLDRGRDDAGVPAVGHRAPQAHLHPAARHHRAGHQPGVLQDRPHLPGPRRARLHHAPHPRRHQDRHRHPAGDHRVLRPHRTAHPVRGPVPPGLVRLAGCAVGRPGRPGARRLRPPRQANPLRPRPHPRRPHREHVHPDPQRRRPGRSDRLVDVPFTR